MVRTSMILGGVSLLLLAFILFFERGSTSTGELEARQGKVLVHFVRDRVEAIEVQRRGVTMRVARGPDRENDLDLGAWMLEAPLKAAADQDAVEVLVGELEWLEAQRTLQSIGKDDLTRFGLDKPRYRVRFATGRRRDVLLVGSDTPTGDGTYVQLAANPGTAYVVGKDLTEAIDQPAGHYHTKELHDGLTIYGSERATLRDTQGERVVEKKAGQWLLVKPERGLAAFAAIEGLFSALDQLRASRFVAERPAKPSDYGLDAPVFEAQVVRKRYDDKLKKPTDELETHVFRVGKPCAGHERESYLRMGDAGPVVCVLDDDWKKAQLPLAALREKRLLPFDDTQIERLELRRDGRVLTLTEKDGAWTYALTNNGKSAGGGRAHTAQLKAWLAALHASEVQRFAPQDQVSATATKLAQVRTTLHVDRRGEYPDYTLKVGEPELDGVPAHRNDEPGLIHFAAEAAALLDPFVARLRDPIVLNEAEGKLHSLEVRRASGPSERIERTSNSWQFVDPKTEAAQAPTPNAVTVGELARLLSRLEALRFVADQTVPGHALDAPALNVAFAYGTSDAATRSEHRLRVGAETEGGRFAQLDADPAVFVVPAQLVALLQSSIASQPPVAAPPLTPDAGIADPSAPAHPTAGP